MSPREKKLLIFFAAAGFIAINFIAFNSYTKKRLQITANLRTAEQTLEQAQIISERREEVAGDMEWITKHEPTAAAYQDVQSALQQLVERQAQSSNLTIKPNSQKLLPTDQTQGNYYHRAKVQITVTGMEKSLYEWFASLNNPEQFRAVTNIILKPDTQDDTKIDCTAIIEQWFVPATL